VILLLPIVIEVVEAAGAVSPPVLVITSEEDASELSKGSALPSLILIPHSVARKFENAADGNILKPFILEGVVEDNAVFGVPLKCKIDRVDVEYRIEKNEMLPTGRYVVYDYKKKGINGINDILDNKDYQLPIYYFLIEKELKEKLNLDNLECMALLYLSVEKTGTKIELDGLYMTEYKKILGISKKGDITHLPKMSKRDVAAVIIDKIAGLFK
jgi:hypothetical protein